MTVKIRSLYRLIIKIMILKNYLHVGNVGSFRCRPILVLIILFLFFLGFLLTSCYFISLLCKFFRTKFLFMDDATKIFYTIQYCLIIFLLTLILTDFVNQFFSALYPLIFDPETSIIFFIPGLHLRLFDLSLFYLYLKCSFINLILS